MGKLLDLEHLRLVLPTPFGQSWRQEAVAGAEGIASSVKTLAAMQQGPAARSRD